MKSRDAEYEVVIKGARLLMHNEQLANPFNHYTQELAKVTHKRKKTIEDHRLIAEIEFQGGLYWDEKEGPYVPARSLNKMIVQGARRRKLGKTFEEMVIVEREVNPILYKGPRGRKEMWSTKDADGNCLFADQRLVGIGKKRTLRTRPLFRDWSCRFVVKVVDNAVDKKDVVDALDAAQQIGLGDGRPVYGGQFVVVSLEVA